MSTAFLFVVIVFMIENRYSNMEKQLSNSVSIIAEENVRTVFYGYFCWDRMKEAVEEVDQEFLSYFLDHLVFHNSYISGARIVKEEIIIGRSGDDFEYMAGLGVPEAGAFKALSSGDGIIVSIAIEDSRGETRLQNAYVAIKIELASIVRLLTDEKYSIAVSPGTPVFGDLRIRLHRRWNFWNYLTIAIGFLISYAIVLLIQLSTGRKVNEINSKEQELLLENISTMVWYFKDSRTFGRVNRAFAEFFGRPRDQIENHKISDILAGNDLLECINGNEEIFDSKKTKTFEQSSKNSENEMRIVSVTKTPILGRGNKVEAIICSAEDITDRKKAEREIRLIQFALDNANEEVFWIAPRGEILYVNRVACETLGYSREELLRMRVEDVDPTDEAKQREYYWKNLKEKGQEIIETYHRTKGGTVFPVEVNRNYLTFEGQEYEFSFARDISERRKARAKLERDKYRIESLHGTALKMERCSDGQEVFDLIIDAAKEILDFDICFVSVVEGDQFVIKASANLAPEDPLLMPLNVGIVGKTYRERESYVIQDIQNDESAFKSNDIYHGGLSVPVGSVGVFQAMSVEKGKFGESEIRLAELLMSHANEAISRIDTEREMAYMSLHDRLTDLYNRVFFEEELKRLEDSRFYPISIISADVDGLKLINDTMGHSKGDDILRTFAAVLKSSMRKTDVIARFGGDEFAAILPIAATETAEKIIVRIRDAVNSYNLSGEGPLLSVSLGVATSNGPQEPLIETLKFADDLMYRDKLYRSSSVRSQMVNTLLVTLAEKDQIASGHAARLQDLCMKLGNRIGLSPRQLVDLALFAQVHDLGKVGIPDKILFKPAKLSEDEWEIMKLHPEKGYRIAVSSPDLSSVADLILRHHERWDGKGYPLGLQREEIPIECRILAVVDAYDAMTNERPYSRARNHGEALEELKRCAGTQFDPEVVNEFLLVFVDLEYPENSYKPSRKVDN